LLNGSDLHDETHNLLKYFSIKLNNSRMTHPVGFTLIEVVIVIAITGVLASISIPNYIKYREKAQIEVAITEMRYIEKEIVNFGIDNGELPENLNVIGMDKVLDPWGRPYQYLRMGDMGKPRKDHSLHPINTDFDLYSEGKDGKSNAALTSKNSQDDIIRANNGGFVGLVSNY
jgi:general secretion pathway protein G